MSKAQHAARRELDAPSAPPLGDTLTEKEAAQFLALKTGKTLYLWRRARTGPPFVKMGAKAIRYRRKDLEEWQAERVVRYEPNNAPLVRSAAR